MREDMENKNIGGMIYELERDLDACTRADLILYNWKFIYKRANESGKYHLIRKLLEEIGFSPDDIEKVLNKGLTPPPSNTG